MPGMFEGHATFEGAIHGADGAEPLALAVVAAVLWACDLSEDETEVGDLVDSALASVPRLA